MGGDGAPMHNAAEADSGGGGSGCGAAVVVWGQWRQRTLWCWRLVGLDARLWAAF